MRFHLIAIGQRMPRWVAEGFEDYAGRMPPECRLELTALAPGDRGKGANPARARQVEARRLLDAVPKGALTVALDPDGRQWSTEALSEQFAGWLQGGRDVALLVGGPDGLAPDILQRAEQRWSLSRLTLPHMLVRVIVAEQLYRAWSILSNHPYHR
ncbi:MAG: 23S rRNA (pseudouridine(1915)-N(3))-methyltransferase RlmH [Ectothiorhodospiraceae bacterium]|nr:23S rRNA (pseudouridine(1915)-N(3))-methyltransferase RlmH [Ectothiorhodospiraceae bacterium]